MKQTLKETWALTRRMWTYSSGAWLAWRILVLCLSAAGFGFFGFKAGEQTQGRVTEQRIVELETKYVERLKVLEEQLVGVNELLEACKSRLETNDKAMKAAQAETNAARKAYANIKENSTDRRSACARLSDLGFRCH